MEGVDRTAVLGGSFGGLIAQFWTHRNPDRVTHLILSGTAPPDPSRLANHSRAIRILPLIPFPLVRLLLQILLKKLLRGVNEPRWRQEYSKLIASLSKEDLRSRYRLAMDFDRNDHLSDLPKSVNVLILEGDRDRVVAPSIHERLRQVYAQHVSHVFEGSGHSPAMTHPEEWSAVVGPFLKPLS